MTRDERRRRSALIYKKRVDKYKSTMFTWTTPPGSPESKANYASFEEKPKYWLKDTPKLCGGECCCNPRRCGWNKKTARMTRQEIKNIIKLNEELKDAG